MERLQHLAIPVVLLVAKNKRLGNGVAQGADTNLQCAAIDHEGAGVERSGVVRERHGGIGHREQAPVPGRVAQQCRETPGLHKGIVTHERQVRVELTQRHIGAGAALLKHIEHIRCRVRITGQGELHAVVRIAKRQQLAEHIHPGGADVPGDVGVVAADVVLLRAGNMFHGAGLDVELTHFHVRWQASGAQV